MCNLCRMNICLILEVTLFPWLILYHLTVREQNYCEECTVLLSFLSQKNLQSKICVIQLFIFVQNVHFVHVQCRSCSTVSSAWLQFPAHKSTEHKMCRYVCDEQLYESALHSYSAIDYHIVPENKYVFCIWWLFLISMKITPPKAVYF